jgi:hypothetical protein
VRRPREYRFGPGAQVEGNFFDERAAVVDQQSARS